MNREAHSSNTVCNIPACHLDHDLIAVFLQDPNHSSLLVKMIHNPLEENRELVVRAFQRFVFHTRFTRYLSSLIRFADIDYHRKRKRAEERSLLIFDTPIGDDGDVTLGEQLLHPTQANRHDPTHNPECFLASIENIALHKAITKLTERQKYIITLSYSACELDTEIADRLKVTQQAVSKARKTAIKKLRNSIVDVRIGNSNRKGVS